MSIEDAIDKACSAVGINPPKRRDYGRWLQTDTLSGKNGKGDGRVIINETHVTAHNWQTGENVTVGIGGDVEKRDRQKIAQQIQAAKRKQEADAARAAQIATSLVAASRVTGHPYLITKGFRDEKAMVVAVADVRRIGGDYLAPNSDCCSAVLVPVRIGDRVTSAQLIWEDGTKKFLFGGSTSGASHRVSSGVDTWLCEGYATAITVRTALHGMKVKPTVLCCFSASNIAAIAERLQGRGFIAGENDKALPQFGGIGASEYYARKTALPFGTPETGSDFNDLYQQSGVFAVQRSLTGIMATRSVRGGA